MADNRTEVTYDMDNSNHKRSAAGHHLGRGLLATAVMAIGCGDVGVDSQPLVTGEEGCTLGACHERVEVIHYGGAVLACVDCHGGDPNALTKEAAHPTVSVSFNPSTPGTKEPGGSMLRGVSLKDLDELDPEILQFLNPADYRVVNNTCGSTTRGGGNCHTRIAQTSVLSTHATLAGQLAGGLYFGGLTDKGARYGVTTIEDQFPSLSHGFATSVERLPGETSAMEIPDDVARGYFATFGQLCVECHLMRDGFTAPGKYTSSGCNACHMVTSDDSKPITADPTQVRDEAGHALKHRLTNLIPDSQCNRCHHAHLHRGLLIQGIRERSEPEGDRSIGGENLGIEDPENIVYWSAENYVRESGGFFLYDKPFPFYVEDEDSTNDIDETPPDIHFEKGMACIDCHTMAEVHGGNHLAVRRDFETRVRCESCHGTPQDDVNVRDLPFQIALSRAGGNADNPQAIERNDDGELVQLGKLDGVNHPVTQISERASAANERFNPRVLMGCGLHAGSAEFRGELAALFGNTNPADVDEVFPGMPEGSTLAPDVGEREGRVECFACHNTWTVNCYGCHVVRDDRQSAVNQVNGQVQAGKISNFPMSVVADGLALGFNARARISPMVGTAIFFTHIDKNGDTIVDAQPLTTVEGLGGEGSQHNPVHHHTIRRQPRDCQGCHPRDDGEPDDENALKRALGIGTGEFVFIDGDERTHLLDRLVMVDFDGDGTFDDPTGAPLVAPSTVERIAASTHLPLIFGDPQPGPLDRETIIRLLESRVVPQRTE